MQTFNPLRILARSPRWQILYARSKDVSGLQLFANHNDFTQIQIAFLQWLEIYSSLEQDLGMREKNISREVIEDDYRCDAYLYWRSIKDKDENKRMSPQEGYEPPANIPAVVFKKR